MARTHRRPLLVFLPACRYSKAIAQPGHKKVKKASIRWGKALDWEQEKRKRRTKKEENRDKKLTGGLSRSGRRPGWALEMHRPKCAQMISLQWEAQPCPWQPHRLKSARAGQGCTRCAHTTLGEDTEEERGGRALLTQLSTGRVPAERARQHNSCGGAAGRCADLDPAEQRPRSQAPGPAQRVGLALAAPCRPAPEVLQPG